METWRRAWFGFAVFAFCWLVVLTVRPLRNRWQMQLLDGTTTYSAIGPEAVLPVWLKFDLSRFRPEYLDFDRYRFSHPKDRTVVLLETDEEAGRQWGTIAESMSSEMDKPVKSRTHHTGRSRAVQAALRVYDRSIRAHSVDAALIAQRMRWSMESVFGPAAEDVSGYSDIPTPSQLEADLVVARLGSRAEPANSYFDMCIAAIYLALNQQGNAFAALHRAAYKSTFNDHLTELNRARMLNIGGTWNPVLIEDQETLWNMPLSFLNWYHTFAERALGPASDLPATRDLMRLGALIRDSDGSNVAGYRGVSVQDTAWQLRGPQAKPKAGKKPIHNLMDRARAFAEYAGQLGQPALGHEAIAQGELDTRFLLQSHEFETVRARYSARNDAMVRSGWAATAVLALSYTLVLWLFVLSALFGAAHRRLPPVQTPDRKPIAPAVAWASGLLFIMLLTILSPRWLPGSLRLFGESLIAVQQNDNFNNVTGDYIALTWLRSTLQYGPILWGILFYWIAGLWRRRHASGTEGVRIGRLGTVDHESFFVLVLVAAVSFVLFTLQRGHRSAGYSIDKWPVVISMAVISAVGLVSFALLIWRALRTATARPARYSALCFLAAAVIFISVVGCAEVGYAESYAFDYVSPTLLSLSLLLCFLGVVLHLRRELQAGAAIAAEGLYGRLQWYRSYLGAMLVVASVAYLAISVAAMPARARSEAWLDRVIAQGELPVVRQMPVNQQMQAIDSSSPGRD